MDEMLREAQQQRAAQRTSERRCPHCGAPVDVFASHCPSCGQELRDRQSSDAVKRLASRLQELEQNEPSQERVRRVKKQILREFILPRKHEDLIELLTLAASNCNSSDRKGKKGFISRLADGDISFLPTVLALSLGFFLVLFIGLTLTIPKDDELRSEILTMSLVLGVFGGFLVTIPFKLYSVLKGEPERTEQDGELTAVWRELAQDAIKRLRQQDTSQEEQKMIDRIEKQIR